MKRITVSLPAALGLSILACAFSASAEAGPRYRDLKSQALGRTGVASSQGATSLFLNPGALGGRDGGGMGLSMDLGINSVLLDYADWAAKNYKYMNNMDTLLTKIEPVDNKWAPFAQGMALHGRFQDIAFAVVSDTRYDLTIGKAVVTPVPGIGVLSDLILTAGRGFEGPEGYRLGFALKYLYRVRFENQLVGTTDEAFYKVNDAWQKPGNSTGDKLDKIKVASEIAETRQGVGLNLGVEKDVTEDWTGGISLLDFPTILDAEFARPDINLGLAYHHGFDLVPDLEDRLLVNLDFQRFLLPGTPWFKQIKMGAAFEANLGNRPVGFIALGLNDGYPTFGLRFGYIGYLSYIYTAEEIGTYPGQQKLSFHKLGFQLEI